MELLKIEELDNTTSGMYFELLGALNEWQEWKMKLDAAQNAEKAYNILQRYTDRIHLDNDVAEQMVENEKQIKRAFEKLYDAQDRLDAAIEAIENHTQGL